MLNFIEFMIDVNNVDLMIDVNKLTIHDWC